MNDRFEYKGYEVEITSDPVTIIAGGRDYTPFWNGKDSPETWIKGMLDAQRRSELERTIRDLAERTTKQGPDHTAKRAKIATVPDESRRPQAPETRKRIVGPRMFSMITGETTPEENTQLTLLITNYQKLPPDVQHQLMNTRLPIADLVEMLRQHAAQSGNEDLKRIITAVQRLPDSTTQTKQTSDAEEASWQAYLASRKAKISAQAERAQESITSADVPELAAIFDQPATKVDAMWNAWKRKNRVSKAVRIIIANILAVPVYALLNRIGLGWASWFVTIIVIIYSMLILVSPGTQAAWLAHVGKWSRK
jgi:hypothetical protein